MVTLPVKGGYEILTLYPTGILERTYPHIATTRGATRIDEISTISHLTLLGRSDT
jgi:hypothetical protein